MVQPADGLNDPAQQAVGGVRSQTKEAVPIERSRTVFIEFQRGHGRLGHTGLSPRTLHAICKSISQDESATLPNAYPLESGVPVGRILDPGQTARLEEGSEACPPHAEQRPQQSAVAPFYHCRHAGESVGSAPVGGTHGDGLGLVVGVMGDQQMKDAEPTAGREQQPVASGSGSRLQPMRRLRTTPVQDLARHPLPLQKRLRRRGLVRRLAPQAMVDRQPDRFAASRRRPFMSEQRQRQRIATSGNRYGQNRPALEWPERRHQRSE